MFEFLCTLLMFLDPSCILTKLDSSDSYMFLFDNSSNSSIPLQNKAKLAKSVGLGLHLYPCYVYSSSEGSGKSGHMG